MADDFAETDAFSRQQMVSQPWKPPIGHRSLFPSDPEDNSGMTPYHEYLISRAPPGYVPLTFGVGDPDAGDVAPILKQYGWKDPQTGAMYIRPEVQQQLLDIVDSKSSALKGMSGIVHKIGLSAPLLMGGGVLAAGLAAGGAAGGAISGGEGLGSLAGNIGADTLGGATVGSTAGIPGLGEFVPGMLAESGLAPGIAGLSQVTPTLAGSMGAMGAGVGAGMQGIASSGLWETLLKSFNLPTNLASNIPKIAGSLASYFGSQDLAKAQQAAGQQGAALSDPFAPQRGFYQDQLKQSYTDPNYFSNNTVFKGLRDQALNSTQAKLASQGYNMSGNMLSELAKVSTNEGYKFAQPFQAQLAQNAGAGISPGYAGYLASQGGNQAAQTQYNGLGNLGVAGQGLWDMISKGLS